ncbi:response regulator [Enterovirga sp. CN4-39]|uniref:response regulator n=1 Tax=Enterovirga sp. CN4-39 TaxID=3400910 RepID=UPI003C11F4AE
MSEALAELGHDVEVANDGEEGYAAVMRLKPDLVISDIRMPRMTGFELLEKVAAAGPPVGDVPFVFLTALADRDNELAGRKLGADDYLTKPVDFEMLGVIVESRLHGRHTPDPSIRLTPREKEVLTWVGRGKTSSEIGIILGLRERTVNFHCDQAMRRLDVMNRTQAVAKAMNLRLINV